MPVERYRWRLFAGGFFGAGSRDAMPDMMLRRATGVSDVWSSVLASRRGSTVIAELDAHSGARFNGDRYQGQGTEYFRNGGGAPIRTGLDGTKLTHVRAQPTLDVEDYLFVAGGGALFKVSPDGVASQWGITPPEDGFIAAVTALSTVAIDAMETAASWTGVGAALADEATIKQEGTNSMRVTVAASTTGTATKSITVNLAQYSATAPSADEDFIHLWFRVDHPENLDKIMLDFSLGGTTFATDYYSRTVVMSSGQLSDAQLSQQSVGLGSQPLINTIRAGATDTAYADTYVFGANVAEAQQSTRLQEAVGQTTFPNALNQWTRLRLPKSTFQRSGVAALTWADVQAAKLTFQTNAGTGGIVAYVDDFKLAGAVGMQGTYKYHITYRNSVTGTRSNSNPSAVMVENVMRQAVALSRLPVSTDPQVDEVEVWRTVGNGVLFFKIGDVTNGVTTFTDSVADAATLDSRADAPLMEDTELPLDNIRPTDSWDDAAGPHLGSMLWARSPIPGEKGFVFISPPGRTEAVRDRLAVSSDDDPVLKVWIFNGAAYAVTPTSWYQLVGQGPFVPRKVYGVPGTPWPLSLANTPKGVVYVALDGPRLFDGVGSTLLWPAAVAGLFREGAVENVVWTPGGAPLAHPLVTTETEA